MNTNTNTASLTMASPSTTAPTAAPADFSLGTLERQALARHKRRHAVVISLRIAIFVVFVGLWEAATAFGWIDPFFFGRPSGVARQIYEWFTEGTSQGSLWAQMAVTLEETVLGFLIGSVAGIVCGIALGRNRFLADVFSLYIKIANSIPRVVLGSIFIISLGLGMASKVALAVVMVFFVVFANAFQGVREADRAMIANAQILGASQWQLTTTVVIPSAMSWILASLHVSFGFALVGAVVGEFLGSKQGIGLLISTAQGAFNANGVFAAMIILAVLALGAEYLITLIENRLVRWKPAQLSDLGA
jgi:NitT/TauT family transport system permease protein